MLDENIIPFKHLNTKDKYTLYIQIPSDNEEEESFQEINNIKIAGFKTYIFRNTQKTYVTIVPEDKTQELPNNVFGRTKLNTIVFTEDMYDRNWFIVKN